MKHLLLAAGLFAGACCAGLRAETVDEHAIVPFDFWLGQKLLPAGDYVISHMASGAVIIREQGDGGSAAVFLAGMASRPESQRAGLLVFSRYGNTYFLQKIWKPNQTQGFTVPLSSREKELLSSASSRRTNVAVASK